MPAPFRRHRQTFAKYEAPPHAGPLRSRSEFAGLSPAQAVDALMQGYGEHRELKACTIRQKRTVLKFVLMELQSRGRDLATVTTEDLALYRSYLASLVGRRLISCNYAAHQVMQWNATMRAVFGEQERPGEGMVMRGFKQSPRIIDHLTQQDFADLLDAMKAKQWQNRHYRELFTAYLELSWCAAARIGSLVHDDLLVRDLDLERGVLHMRHVKNRPRHDVVLSARAVDRLETWIHFLQVTRYWQGLDTPLFVGPRGKVIMHQAVNRVLHELQALAGLNKSVTSHVFRKSAGTIMALVNPKLAQEQLGITEKVFNRHYNMPLLEDRLAHREILPGVAAAQPSPEESVGNAYLRYQRGEIGKVQLDQIVLMARLAAIDPRRKVADTAYA